MPFLYQTFYNFRNLKNDTIDLSPKEIFFVGENGQQINPNDALLYKWMGYNRELTNHTATPDRNIYIRNAKNFSQNYKMYN